jgi:hypothetical protein
LRKQAMLFGVAGFVWLCFWANFAGNHAFSKELRASTPGRFDENYVKLVRKRKNSEVTEIIWYEVTYTFEVAKRSYRGADIISNEPSAVPCLVFYDPRDPADNALTPQRARPILLGVSAVPGVLLLIAAAVKARA